jgi:hypothetical protein
MMIHDHYDGMAHCVECKGHCQLSGDELNVTRTIRYLVESLAYQGLGLGMMTRDALRDLGLDPERIWKRARGAVKR